MCPHCPYSLTMNSADSSKVEARMRWIKRRREELAQTGDPDLALELGSGPANRHGMPQVPEGQHVVKKWPVLDLGHQPEIAPEDWELEIHGLCDKPLRMTWQDLLARPQVTEQSDFHCVTTWSLLDSEWTGVRLADLLAEVEPQAAARFLLVTAYDHDPGSGIPYTTNLSLADALSPDVLLVHNWQGQPLPREHGGPVRMITPRLYAWKGAKWIRSIELLAEDRLGFWERRGYSNTARPWANDRFSRS